VFTYPNQASDSIQGKLMASPITRAAKVSLVFVIALTSPPVARADNGEILNGTYDVVASDGTPMDTWKIVSGCVQPAVQCPATISGEFVSGTAYYRGNYSWFLLIQGTQVPICRHGSTLGSMFFEWWSNTLKGQVKLAQYVPCGDGSQRVKDVSFSLVSA
jgi:hypothetical protein